MCESSDSGAEKILHISQFSSYFIEFTRQEGEKKRTTSRKKFLDDVYKAAKKTLGEEEGFKETEEQLSKVDEDKLKNKKLYYYFMQLGRDVYTGEKIDLDILLAKNSDYDIDHIIPQARVKDDSFTNMVLVNQSANRHKSDSYPIPQGIVTPEGRKWIKTLNKISIGNRSLMPKEKMDRILRPENRPLDPSEIEGFVNRQLTSTNQSTAAVADVLKESDPDARVVYSRAENVSDFRKLFDLPKCREVNDYHHAHDAYLNIVVGNVFDMVFSRGNNRKFDAEVLRWKNEHKESLKTAVSCVFTRDERKFMTDKLVWKSKKYVLDEQNNPKVDPETGLPIEKNEEPLGDPNRHNQPTIDLVCKTLAFDDPMVTHMATEQSQGGFFSKVTLHSGKANNARYPQKQKAPFNSVGWEKKYGGYGDLTTPYYMVIRSEGKKDKKTGEIRYIYSIEGVPSIYLARKNKEEAIIEYITAVRKRINPKILVPKLLIGTILVLPEHVGINDKKEGGNVRVRITSSNEKNLGTANDTQLHLPKEQYAYFKKIAKVLGTNSPANNKPDLKKYDAVGQGDIKVDKYSSLTQKMNLKTFDVLVAALQRPCFTNLPGVGNTLRDLPKKKNLFTTLSTIKQVIVLQNILMLVGCRTGLQDLSLLGMGTKLGGKLISKTLVPGTKIIFTSTTGFYEKVIFEVPEE